MHSCTSGECKTSCIQANRKICGPLLPLHGCPLHSCTEPCSLEEMPSSWLLPGEGKRRLNHISNVLTFWVTLPKRVGPDLENCWDLAYSRYLETAWEQKRTEWHATVSEDSWNSRQISEAAKDYKFLKEKKKSPSIKYLHTQAQKLHF